MLSIKIQYKDEIHRISDLPSSLKLFKEKIICIFNHPLPKDWSLKYDNPEGIMIALIREQDYTELVDQLRKSPRPVKFHIIDLDNLQTDRSSSKISEPISETPGNPEFNKGNPKPNPQTLPNSSLPYTEKKVNQDEKQNQDYNNQSFIEKISEKNPTQAQEIFQKKKAEITQLIKDLNITPKNRENLFNGLKILMNSLTDDEKIQMKIATDNLGRELKLKADQEKKPEEAPKTEKSKSEIIKSESEENTKTLYENILKEFAHSYSSISPEKKSEFNELLHGVPEKIMKLIQKDSPERQASFYLDNLQKQSVNQDEKSDAPPVSEKEESKTEQRDEQKSPIRSLENLEEAKIEPKNDPITTVKKEEPLSKKVEAQLDYNIQYIKPVSAETAWASNHFIVTKTIRVKNTGKLQWPKGSMLINTTSNIITKPLSLEPLEPGKEANITVEMKCPNKMGCYSTNWGLYIPQKNDMLAHVGNPIKISFELIEKTVKSKAETLKEMFPQVSFETIKSFVEQNCDLQFEELIQNFLYFSE